MDLTYISGAEASENLTEKAQKAINDLPKGVVLAVYMRNTSTDEQKVTVEFREKFDLTGAPESALQTLNPDDSRFARRAKVCWETADRATAYKMFGVEIADGEGMVEILKIVPKLNEKEEFKIQVIEFLESEMTDEQKEYAEKYLKQIPSTGQYFYDKVTGQRICQRRRLIKWNIGQEVPHILKDGEYKSPVSAVPAGKGDLASTFAI